MSRLRLVALLLRGASAYEPPAESLRIRLMSRCVEGLQSSPGGADFGDRRLDRRSLAMPLPTRRNDDRAGDLVIVSLVHRPDRHGDREVAQAAMRLESKSGPQTLESR